MNKLFLTLALYGLCCTAAYSQTKSTTKPPDTPVSTSTDPAKAAEVEQHAQQIKEDQEKKATSPSKAKSSQQQPKHNSKGKDKDKDK
jgi:hypothetical protein